MFFVKSLSFLENAKIKFRCLQASLMHEPYIYRIQPICPLIIQNNPMSPHLTTQLY